MISVRYAAALLAVHLVLLGQAHAQHSPSPAMSSMPSPIAWTDPGARCWGWVPCATIDPWDVTLRVDPWYAAPTVDRGDAASVRGALVMDLARHVELGISAAMLT